MNEEKTSAQDDISIHSPRIFAVFGVLSLLAAGLLAYDALSPSPHNAGQAWALLAAAALLVEGIIAIWIAVSWRFVLKEEAFTYTGFFFQQSVVKYSDVTAIKTHPFLVRVETHRGNFIGIGHSRNWEELHRRVSIKEKKRDGVVVRAPGNLIAFGVMMIGIGILFILAGVYFTAPEAKDSLGEILIILALVVMAFFDGFGMIWQRLYWRIVLEEEVFHYTTYFLRTYTLRYEDVTYVGYNQFRVVIKTPQKTFFGEPEAEEWEEFFQRLFIPVNRYEEDEEEEEEESVGETE